MSADVEILNAALLPLGFTPQARRTAAHHYTGTLGGRTAQVYVSQSTSRKYGRTYSYVGHLLEITVFAPLKTRVVFGTKNDMVGWINRRFKLQEFDIPPPGFGEYSLYGLEERWTRQFVSDSDIDAALREILADERFITIFSVQVKPETMSMLLRADLNRYTPENVARWVSAFDKLVDTATRLFPPSNPVEASAWERWAQKNRHLMVWVAVGAFFGIVVLFMLLAAFGCLVALLIASNT